jgi:hypothetical protein
MEEMLGKWGIDWGWELLGIREMINAITKRFPRSHSEKTSFVSPSP